MAIVPADPIPRRGIAPQHFLNHTAVDRLGFLLTSFVILAVLFRIFSVGWKRTVITAAIATLAIHFAFYKLLRVPLPWGFLTPYAW